MKFKKLNSSFEVNVNTAKYSIDWSAAVSRPQKKVKDFLHSFWRYDNVLEEFVIPGSKLRIDLLNLTKIEDYNGVAVEISPQSSHSFNSFFHKDRVGGFLASVKRDLGKMEWIQANGFLYISLDDADLKNLTVEMFLEKGLQL